MRKRISLEESCRICDDNRDWLEKKYKFEHYEIKDLAFLINIAPAALNRYFVNNKIKRINRKAHSTISLVAAATFIPGLDKEYISKFNDLQKFRFLLKNIPRSIRNNEKLSKEFIEKFYNDRDFNYFYNDWLNIENKASFAKPSLDHIISLSKGGTDELSNLRFIPWCLNRAKCDFSPEDWSNILKEINKNRL